MQNKRKNKIRANKKIEAILFDFDGVIINSFEAWYQAFNAMLKEFGREKIGREEFKDKCWGPDLRYNLEMLNLDENAEKYCIEQQKKLIDKIKLFPGIKGILKLLKKKYKIGLVTNTPKDNVQRILEYFDMRSLFDAIVTGDEVKKGKPSPEIIIKACSLLKISPERAILVGDTESDLIAGKTAGCIVIGIGKKIEAANEKAKEADKAGTIIKNISDLPYVLKVIR